MTNQDILTRAQNAVAWIPGDQGLWKEMIDEIKSLQDQLTISVEKEAEAKADNNHLHEIANNRLNQLRRDVHVQIRDLKVTELSPLEALTKLFELQRLAKG